MQTFINPIDNSIWEFDNDVTDIFAFPNTPAGLVTYVRPSPTSEDIEAARVAAADAQRTALLAVSTAQVDILTDATDPDIVEDPTAADIALLVLWKKYRQALRLVATSANPVAWPYQPAYPAGT